MAEPRLDSYDYFLVQFSGGKVKVTVEGVTPHRRPARQGGLWYTAKKMCVLEKA
jgi:hypothetical protein